MNYIASILYKFGSVITIKQLKKPKIAEITENARSGPLWAPKMIFFAIFDPKFGLPSPKNVL